MNEVAMTKDNISLHRQPVTGLYELRTLVDKVIRHWYYYAIGIVVMLLAAWGYLRFALPHYRVKAKVLVLNDGKDGRSTSIKQIGQFEMLGGSESNNTDNEVEILNSYSLMEKVVREKGLNVTFFTVDGWRKQELAPGTPFNVRWMAISRLQDTAREYILKPEGQNNFLLEREGFVLRARWNDLLHLPEGTVQFSRNRNAPLQHKAYLVVIQSLGSAVEHYRRQMTTTIPNKRVSVIELSIKSTVPKRGELLLNALIDTYINSNIEARNRIADNTISFVESRLEVVKSELADIESGIQEFKQANILADMDEQSRLLVENTGDLMRQLTDQQVKLEVVESLQRYMGENHNDRKAVPSSLIIQDPAFATLADKYNELQLEREQQLLSGTEANPVIRNIDRQLAGLYEDMQFSLASVKNGIALNIDELKHRAATLNQRIQKVPEEERIYLDYSRQRSIKQELYLFLLQKREEAAIEKMSRPETVRIIDEAVSEPFPYAPSKPLVCLIALILGIGIPGGVLYLKALLNRKVYTRQDIANNTLVPVLAEIGHSNSGTMIMNGNGATIVAEQFHVMCANLQLALAGTGKKVILLTSGRSGEGKTFVAINLAFALALSGKRVALMEMDLRRPGISRMLNIDQDKGLSAFFNGSISTEQLIRPSGIHINCSIISAGARAVKPTELLLSDLTGQLVQQLRKDFDYVIIDTAPVGPVADARLLARVADTTLYLVRQRYTFKQQLEVISELYHDQKMPDLRLVINDVKPGSHYSYSTDNYSRWHEKKMN